jgi:hypothetical protein
MWHWDQIPINDIFCHEVPLLDNEVIVSLLSKDATIELRWHTSFEIVILQKINELERG